MVAISKRQLGPGRKEDMQKDKNGDFINLSTIQNTILLTVPVITMSHFVGECLIVYSFGRPYSKMRYRPTYWIGLRTITIISTTSYAQQASVGKGDL